MYLFLLFGLPLGFLLLVLDQYPQSEFAQTRGAFAKGVAAFIPTWLIARILGSIVPARYGSFLICFHEWADRLLPYAVLPALAYLVFFKLGDRLPPGTEARRLTAFYAGALSPVGVCETARAWGSPSPYTLFLLPFILAAICLAMPKVMTRINQSYGFALAMRIVGVAAVTLLASLCPYFFLARLWPLSILLIAGLGLWTGFLAYEELRRRAAIPFDE
jgi:hypothetical protein